MMQPSESPCQPLGVVPPTDRDAAVSKGDDDVVVVTGDRDHGERKTLTLLSSDDDNPSIPADLLVVAHDQQDTQVCSSPCPAKLIDCSSIWGTRAHTRTQARNQANLVRTTFSLTDGLTSSACVRSCDCACLPACLPACACISQVAVDLAKTLDKVGDEQAASPQPAFSSPEAVGATRMVPDADDDNTPAEPLEAVAAPEPQNGKTSSSASLSTLENLVYNADEVRVAVGSLDTLPALLCAQHMMCGPSRTDIQKCPHTQSASLTHPTFPPHLAYSICRDIFHARGMT